MAYSNFHVSPSSPRQPPNYLTSGQYSAIVQVILLLLLFYFILFSVALAAKSLPNLLGGAAG